MGVASLAPLLPGDASPQQLQPAPRLGSFPCDGRLPADDADIQVRAVVLAQRAANHSTTVNATDDGRVTYRGRWVGLSPLEQSLLRTLADSIGDVVSYETLFASAWPEGNGSGPALRVHILRLRRRILPIGLEIRTVPKRGYVLEASA